MALKLLSSYPCRVMFLMIIVITFHTCYVKGTFVMQILIYLKVINIKKKKMIEQCEIKCSNHDA